MKFIAAIATFGFALILDAPFFGAVMLGAAAWFVVHFAGKGGETTRQTGSDPRTVAEQSADQSAIYALAERVTALEQEVRALKRSLNPAAETIAREARPSEPAPVEAAPPEFKPAEPAPAAPKPAEIEPVELEPAATVYSALPPQPPTEQPIEPPAEPAGPSFLSNLLSGNIVAKVGAIILFFGVGFLLKFAYDRNMVPPEVRLAGVALAAIVVFILGWKLLEKRRLYGIILQGVASGLGYLDVFFALKTYAFIGAPTAFGLFGALGVATTLLAVRQDAKALALLGLTGAFMAPVLASTGGGQVVVLFSYYLLLNVFILAVSWFKAWRALNLTGWFFTFGVAVLWGSRSYRPELFGTVEPFLLAFFAIYLVIPVLFAMRQPPELKGWVDGTLVFGTPAAVAVLQGHLVWDMPYGLAWSCAVGAALYAVLCVAAFRHRNMQLLGQTYLALAVGLGTLAIFYAFGAYTTFALWTIEGTAILWVCLRQKNLLGRLFAILVQGAGAVQFFLHYDEYLRANPWFNDAVLGCAIIAVAGFISAAMYRKYDSTVVDGEKGLAAFLLAWGALAYSLGGIDAIHHGVANPATKLTVAVVFFSATAVVAELWGASIRWGALRGLTAMHPVILIGAAFYLLQQLSHPLAGSGWVAWPAGLGSLFWILHRQRRDGFDAALEARYVAGWAMVVVLATWEAGWWMEKREYLNAMLIAAVGYAAAALRFRLREHETQNARLSSWALLWSMFFWLGAGLLWIEQRLPAEIEVRAGLAFVAATTAVFWFASRMLEWRALRLASQLPWIAIPIALAAEFALRPASYHPLGDAWALAWLLALGLAGWILRRDEGEGGYFATAYRHLVLLYAPLALVTWEIEWWLVDQRFGPAWQMALLSVPTALALRGITASRGSQQWPLNPHWPLYRDALLMPIVIGLALWVLAVNLRTPGSLAPLAIYIPLLNPIDVAVALAAFALVGWIRSRETGESRQDQDTLWKGVAVLGFLWTNAIALRTIHYWADIPYRFDHLMSSVLVQATLSILWTSAALSLMVLARRRMERKFWIAGAALLAVVVSKLFLVDLANTGTVARIVSFLGVGVILLVIGYVAPVPPGAKEAEGRG